MSKYYDKREMKCRIYRSIIRVISERTVKLFGNITRKESENCISE